MVALPGTLEGALKATHVHGNSQAPILLDQDAELEQQRPPTSWPEECEVQVQLFELSGLGVQVGEGLGFRICAVGFRTHGVLPKDLIRPETRIECLGLP